MSAFLITAGDQAQSNDSWVRVPNEPMADRVAISRPPSSGVVGGGVFCVTLVVIPTGVSASGAGYPPTIPSECETEPDHPDPEDEMQEVIGSVHGHEVGRRFLADDEPVHEQH
jgi:hypothetical protein